ncbi:MAG TPA: ribulokinase, partial [bacterium]|nr:ribulokinase [bacterium]
MAEKRYALGIDFGTESGRALLVDIDTGEEVATSVLSYAHGVLDEYLPDGKTKLDPDFALQDPADWLEVLGKTVPDVLKQADAKPEQVVGIGVDFTSCTVLPVDAAGEPLSFQEKWRSRPNAWCKLWKHHAAQPEADKINELARKRGESFLARYGGKISSEWAIPKMWQVLDEDEEVFRAADRFIEGGDWIVFKLCGKEARSSCMAGYKGMWARDEGFPSPEFLKALDPRLENIIADKFSTDIKPLGSKAGELTPEGAALCGLVPGIAVAVAIIDAHAAVPAATITEAGKMLMVMGTSTCHMLLSKEKAIVPGMAGVVEDGILPGFFGYEAGQAATGDIFAWFTDNCVPASYEKEAEQAGTNVHKILEERAARLRPGQSGVIALDWWNGNRSILVNADLTGLLLGCTLTTKPEEIYRALIEATAFGTHKIISTFKEQGIQIDELYACGGLPERNQLLMRIYSDVTGLEIKVAASGQPCALGAAMLGAVAAGKAKGGYDNAGQAAAKMAHVKDVVYRPNAESHKIYQTLYREYEILHDYFGQGGNEVMRRLKAMKA